MSEYCAVKESQVYSLDERISFDSAVFAEPLGCCIHAVEKSQLSCFDQVVIIGGGTIGMLLLQLLKLKQAKKVLVIDTSAMKQKRALENGATAACSSTGDEFVDALHTYGMEWVDVVFDCVCTNQTINAACKAAHKGGEVVLVGIPNVNWNNSISAFDVFRKELLITGSCLNPQCHTKALDLLCCGQIKTDYLIGDRMLIEGALDCINSYNNDSGKQIIRISS